MKSLKNNSLFLLILLIWTSCSTSAPYYKSEINISNGKPISSVDYEIFLVGDIATDDDSHGQENIVQSIKSQLDPNRDNQAVVFLGNTIQSNGLPSEEGTELEDCEDKLHSTFKELKDLNSNVYFIPGNNEWYDGENYTSSQLQDSEHHIEKYFDGQDVFQPSNRCGDPMVINLTEDLLLILIDSQWLLQGDDSKDRKGTDCDTRDEIEFIVSLQNTLASNKLKNVIIASHHPIYSNGETAGNYSLKSHLVPIPVLGTVLNSVKKLAGTKQQFSHPMYEAFRSAMKTTLSNFEGVVVASAHDHHLQYTKKKKNHFVIAGSGSHVTHSRKGGDADFTCMQKGYSKITHTKEHEVWLEFFVLDPKEKIGSKSIYKKLLYQKEIINYNDKVSYLDNEDQPESIKVSASNKYGKKKLFNGASNRKEWAQEIDVPLLLLDEVYGGLVPIKQGGGFQTKSLRLENAEGRQFVLRTIDKEVDKVVPPELRKTFVKNLVQDGMSSAHPYGAFVVPQLAEAANIYHANPIYVWLPLQKSLGEYNTDFGNKLFLFEERPGGVMDEHENYGGAKRSVSTINLVKRITRNHKHKIDQKYIVNARLFDILIGDWDRHDDQWRWGIYSDPDNPGHQIYKPIPRDRDQVFFKNDGVINYISSRQWFKPQLSKFNYKISSISGLVYNARHFDRTFLNQLSKEDFIEAATNLQEALTDEVLKNNFEDWPEEIYDISGDVIISKLKQRREDLDKYAEEYYLHLSKQITVTGTNGKNVFNLTTRGPHLLELNVYHEAKGIKNLIYQKVIDDRETNELILHGLGKRDTFYINGNDKVDIDVKIIGGKGKDVVEQNAKHIKTTIYDKKEGLIATGNNVKSKLSNHRNINKYDRYDWELDRTLHFPAIGFYTDEGIGLNYNIWHKNSGFRAKPYKSSHKLNVGFYFGTKALFGSYTGHWTDVIGQNWDLIINATSQGPTFIQYYYGLGNNFVDFGEKFPDTPEADTRNFHIVSGTRLNLETIFSRDLKLGRAFQIVPGIEYVNVKDEDVSESRFIYTEESQVSIENFTPNTYASLQLKYTNTRINNIAIPTRGFDLSLGMKYRANLTDVDVGNLNFEGLLKTYIPFTADHSLVLAMNMGASYTFGEYDFYHANYLSKASQLRGYRTNRFAGDGVVYHSTDLRYKIFSSKGGFPTGYGIFASFDYGRSFLESDDNNQWHSSFGGGIYLMPLNLFGFKIGYYQGAEDSQLSVGGSLAF